MITQGAFTGSTHITRSLRGAGLFIGVASLLIGSAAAAEIVMGCVLSDKQEVPPTTSPALGGGQFLVDTDANTVTYRIAFTGLSAAETAAHIHGPADPGTNGGVLAALPAGHPKVGVWSYAEAQEADILNGKTYVNIHTVAFPGGEIRGQITRLNAALDGGQEVPPAATTGSGWATFTIDTTTNQLGYSIAFGGLVGVETAAHIHGMALHGSNAGVLHTLPLGSPKVGTWTYAEADEKALLSGAAYVNIHSSVFPGGEIRGQIVPVVAPIDGLQEVPSNPSPGAGVALLSVNLVTFDLSYDLRFAGLAGAETAAHIHGFAPPGSNAGVQQALPLGNRKLGLWTFGAADAPQVLAGLTYFNIHSSAVPGGEIRGQIRGLPDFTSSAVEEPGLVSAALDLSAAPNPLRAAGVVQFQLAQAGPIELALYDSQGRVVRRLEERELSAGLHRVAWDGRDDAGRLVPSGVYHYVLKTPRERVGRTLSVVR